jgi:hypothetical protein
MEPATSTTTDSNDNGTEFSLASMLWLLDTPTTPIEQHMPPDMNANEKTTMVLVPPPTSPSDRSANLMVIILF